MFEAYTITALIYLTLTLLFNGLLKLIEKYMAGKESYEVLNPAAANKSGDQMERKEERVMARQSIFKFNERVTTEAKDATYEFRGPVISVRNLEKKFGNTKF